MNGLSDATAILPDRPADPAVALAQALAGAGDDLDAAAWLYQRAGLADAAFADALRSERLLDLAAAWEQAGRPAEALPWYRRAAGRESGQAAALAAAEARCRAGRLLPPTMPPDPRLLEALLRIAPLIPDDWSRLRFAPLSGSRNRLYRIDDPVSGESFALRLDRTVPASPWWRYGREWLALRQAYTLGVAPEPLYVGLADGVLLTRLVPGDCLTRKSFRDPARVARVAQAFRRLHGGPVLPGGRDMFAAVARREAALRGDGGLPDLPRWRERFGDWRALLAANGVPLANGHNDPIAGNMFDLSDRVVLIDWEFAGPTDPDFDLGYVMAAMRQGEAFDRLWMTCCHGRPDHPRAARAAVFRALLHYLWLLKALTAKQAGRPEREWLRRAERSLDFLRGTVSTPAFQQHLEAVHAYRWAA